MNRFRLNCLLYASGMLLSAFLAGVSFSKGWPLAVGVILIGLSIGFMIAFLNLLRRFLLRMRAFVKAIEMKDYTVRFPHSDDSVVEELNESMNRIIDIHKEGTAALETRKLYYDRILRIMTHELRNGISPIVAVGEDMSRNLERYSGEKLKEAVELINDEASDIKRFLDSYFELTHLPKPVKKQVDAVAFFNGIAHSARLVAAEYGIDGDALLMMVAQGMALEIDESLMRRVIMNLLDNAFYFVKDRPAPSVTVSVSTSGGYPFISIADNGCGMDSATLDNLFQPFFTTKPQGNGIGLCLSRHIVRMHGGDITALSVPSRGTTFNLTLPTPAN